MYTFLLPRVRFSPTPLSYLLTCSLLPPSLPPSLCPPSLQFFFTEGDVGKNCAEVSAKRLAELNSYVRVEVEEGSLTNEVIKKFQVLVG